MRDTKKIVGITLGGNMEEREEEFLKILETWMNQDGISKSKQIVYYRKLISELEASKMKLKVCSMARGAGALFAGLGTGLLFPDDSYLNPYLGIGFIILGILFAIQRRETKNELEGFEEIEEKRQLIKKWYEKRKE